MVRQGILRGLYHRGRRGKRVMPDLRQVSEDKMALSIGWSSGLRANSKSVLKTWQMMPERINNTFAKSADEDVLFMESWLVTTRKM